IFAFLGLLRNENKINVLSSVTGASRDHSAGRMATP
ncbi:MAG: anhydro-N-acetylmuramic acid kinase, partial [Bacteroidota bacterium]|nr:anhydro-N-acetylmuramic acid kinase [Bacteroidota bacterium]